MSGPSASRTGFPPGLQAPGRTYCSDQQRARGGGHTDCGGVGLAGCFLGFTPKGTAQLGVQGKSPELTGDSL